jgi:hypothetical protein
MLLFVCYYLWRTPALLSILSDVSVISDCDRRDSTTPRFPVFPNSALQNQSIITNESWETEIIFNYLAHDSYEKVKAYFIRNARFCTEQFYIYRLFCPGDAQPFGSYEIRINHDIQSPLITPYSVYVRWDKCSSDAEIRFGTD